MKKPRLIDLFLYFLKLGCIEFGGSIALAHSMHNDLVEKKHWLTEDEYLRGLTLSQLAPGPLAAQLVIYIGFIREGVIGATLAGGAFILPSFLLVVFLSALYLQFGSLPLIQLAFYGIGAAVIGIITTSAIRLTQKTLKPKILLLLIFFSMFILVAFFRQTSVILFVMSGVLTMLAYSDRKIKLPPILSVALLNPSYFLAPVILPKLEKLFIFFLQAGSFAFGGGLAIVPFLHTGVVEQNHWLTDKQFIDAIAVAMITPGPVVIAATFIGFLTAGLPGAVISTVAIFLPVYIIVILLTPLFIKHAKNPQLTAFVEGVTAAAMGAIAGSIIILGQQSIFDPVTVTIAIASLVLSFKFKVPGVIIVLCAGILSMLLFR